MVEENDRERNFMIRFRKDFIKFLIRKGLDRKALTFARKDGFDIVVLRQDAETFFLFHDDTPFGEVMIKKEIDVTDRSEVLEKINEKNTRLGAMNLSLVNNILCVRAWAEYDFEKLFHTYQKCLRISQEF